MTIENFCTYNYPARFPQAGYDKELITLRDKFGMTVLANQEGFKHGDRPEAVLGKNWGSTFIPDRGGEIDGVDNLPIAWDMKVWEITGQMWLEAYDKTFVGKWGAGPSVMGVGITHGVRLEHKKSRKEVLVVNDHFVPSVVQDQPKNKADAANWSKRRELYDLETWNIVDLTRGWRRIPNILLGDYNAPTTFPMLDKLEARGFEFHAAKGGTRIDLCGLRRAKLLGSASYEGHPGDHEAGIFRVEF